MELDLGWDDIAVNNPPHPAGSVASSAGGDDDTCRRQEAVMVGASAGGDDDTCRRLEAVMVGASASGVLKYLKCDGCCQQSEAGLMKPAMASAAGSDWELDERWGYWEDDSSSSLVSPAPPGTADLESGHKVRGSLSRDA
jgi:hypothetical protein